MIQWIHTLTMYLTTSFKRLNKSLIQFFPFSSNTINLYSEQQIGIIHFVIDGVCHWFESRDAGKSIMIPQLNEGMN